MNWGLHAGTIDLAFDWCQRYWKYLQQSKSRRKASAQESSVLRSEQNKLSVLSEEAKLSELQYSYGYVLDNNKQILAVTLQCHHILMQELENSITKGEPEVPLFGIDIACCDLVKGSYTLILLTHLARSYALYTLILHSPIQH